MATSPVPLENLSVQEARERLGELVGISIRHKGACVILARRTGELTVLDPRVLGAIPDEDIAEALLSSWTEEEILAYLKTRGEGNG